MVQTAFYRLNAELKSKKEAERSLREKSRQQIETALYQLNKAKAIEARAWNSLETVQDQANEISNLKQLVNRFVEYKTDLQYVNSKIYIFYFKNNHERIDL